MLFYHKFAELYDFGGSRYTECESLHTPPYGNVECSDGWKEGSVCSYTCAKYAKTLTRQFGIFIHVRK